MDLRLEESRAVVIEAAAFPMAISTGRGLALGSGAAIRLPPEAATVFIAARTREGGRPALFALGADDTATAVFTEDGWLSPGDRTSRPMGAGWWAR